MKATRLHVGIVVTALATLGAFVAVNAQELFLPPPVLQPDGKPAATPVEKKTEPAKKSTLKTLPTEKAKADPTLIPPPEAFELPRVTVPLDVKPGVVQTGGIGIPTPALQPVLPAAPKEVLPIIPPPMPNVEPKGEPRPITLPMVPTPLPEPTKVLIEPLTKDPPKGAQPPTVVMPGPVGAQPTDKPKAFVRVRSAANEVMPPIDVAPPQPSIGPLPGPIVTPPILPANHGALTTLQTPGIAVEKRGQANMAAGETQTYQIVVRNMGAVPAQQVRIEEEIPAGVKLVAAEPQPQLVGTRAAWTLAQVPAGSEQTIQFSLHADVAVQLGSTTSAFVAAFPMANTTALRPVVGLAQVAPVSPISVRLTGPERTIVGRPVSFDIHVTNQAGLPLTGIVLFGYLPEGLSTGEGRDIEGAVDGSIAPGGSRILKMPANAVKPGRYTVRVKVATAAGEASAIATIDIANDSLMVQLAPMTRLMLGRAGELRIEVANGTGKPLRNVAVASQLPEGVDFLGASERGLYQANHRTVYWLIDTMPAGQSQALTVRVNGTKAGQYQNLVWAKADGVGEMRSTGAIALEGAANLHVRATGQDTVLEVGKETIYELQINNTGGASARNVQLRIQFTPGLAPREANGNTRGALDGQGIVFEPIVTMPPDGQATYRISVRAAAGDQRVRFSVVSDEVQTPLQREVSTKVY